MMFTRDNFRALLRRKWAEQGIDVAPGERVGVVVSEIVELSAERGTTLETPYLDLWIDVLDELISWEISLFTVVFVQGMRDSTPAKSNFDRSVAMLLAKIIGDSLAIRHLVLTGFGVSANTLLRSTAEYMEVFVALLHKPRLADEFVKTDEPEQATEFWKKHIANKQLRGKVLAAWSDFLKHADADDVREMADWGYSHNNILSGLSHASFAGGMFSLLPLKTNHVGEFWPSFWGDRAEWSVETIQTYTQFALPILLLSPDFPYAGYQDVMSEPIDFEPNDELHRHVKFGRNVLTGAVLSLYGKENRHEVFPAYDMSIYPD